MGTFIDPLNGVVPALDVIIHNQGQKDGAGGASSSVNITGINGTAPTLGTAPNAGGLLIALPNDQSLGITGTVVASGAISGTGTAGTAATGVMTVQGIASMTPLIATGSGTAGTAATGVVTVQGIASMTHLLVTPDAGATVQPIPATSGGTTCYHAAVPNNVTGVVVKNTAGQVYGIQISNNSTTIGYLHLYDSTSAPTAGAGTILKTLIAPAPSGGGGGGNNYVNMMGAVFASGIAYTFTAGNGTDTDNTAPAVSTYTINIDYK